MSDTGSATSTYLTQEAFDRLKGEYDQLTGAGRLEIAQRIEAAREEGDLKENGGYHAAKDEQGKMEGRILQLRQLLDSAVVGEPAAADGSISSGTVVTVEVFGDEETFLVGSREIADGSDLTVYSEQSPIGAAVVGHRPGETVSYDAPNGKTIEVVIKDAKPYSA